MKATVVLILSLIASGCAVQSHSPTPVASVDGVPAEPQSVVCEMEKPTGSNRPVKVCRAVDGILDREDTVRDMRKIQRQSE